MYSFEQNIRFLANNFLNQDGCLTGRPEVVLYGDGMALPKRKRWAVAWSECS